MTIVVATNLKILSFASSYSILMVFLLVLSAALGFISWLVVNYFDLGILEHTFYRVLGSSTYYLFAFIVLTVCMIDWSVANMYRMRCVNCRPYRDERALPSGNRRRIPHGGLQGT